MTVLLLLAGLGLIALAAAAWALVALMRRMARELPDRNEGFVLTEHTDAGYY